MFRTKPDARINDIDRSISYVILAVGFSVTGLGCLALGNIPVAVGVFVGSIGFMIAALYYLTTETKRTKKGKTTVN
jgi:hypothetical protein